MPQSLCAVYCHLVFSTKNRAPLLAEEHRSRIHDYLGGALRNIGTPAIAIGSVEDHIHILYSHSRDVRIMDVVRELKSESSGWMKSLGREYGDFHWQSGYGIFSVSQSQLATVESYVLRQREHHRERGFQDEFRGLLRLHRVDFDERYVWD